MSHQVNATCIGRTGNLMFITAATLGYARKHGLTWGMPTDTREVPHFRKMFPNIPVLDGQFKRLNWADPAFFNYQPIPNLHRDTTLVGFYQSEKYFEGQQEEIRRLFKLNIQPEYKDYVSIHVRRGDYVQHANSFPPVTVGYIHAALLRLEERIGHIKNIIFLSDDINWCIENFAFINRSVEFSQGANEFEDLSLMTSCSHNIIANSTFSWWGAWLNPNPDKIVVSPSMYNWFGPGFTGSVPKDIIPPQWHQIKF